MFPSPQTFDEFRQTLASDLAWLLPEAIFGSAMVLMLFLRMFDSFRRLHMSAIALPAAGMALACCARQWYEASQVSIAAIPLFSGQLVNDSLSLYGRVVLSLGTVLFVLLTMLTNVPDRDDSPDFYVLLFGSALGMMLMVQANHLLMIFIAIEMASLPSYVLSGFFKGNRRASEAALKYVVYGAAASGTMLYGMSLLTSATGSGHLPTIASAWSNSPPMLASAGLILVGLAFKLSLFPFHFWLPDVFEGASAEVGAWLSVASKAAAMMLAARFLLVCGGGSSELIIGIASMAAATCTIGNLAALSQTNVKRMLAYSTLAHAGYMAMGLCVLNESGLAAMLFYFPAYLFLNLAAFAAVAFIRNATGSERIADYAGLAKREPLLVLGFSIAICGLLGLPPLVGFAAKFQIFAALFETGREYSKSHSDLGYVCVGLLILAAMNTIISAGYYLKLLRIMVLDEPHDTPIRPVSARQTGYVLLLAGIVVVAGILWNPLEKASRKAIETPLKQRILQDKE